VAFSGLGFNSARGNAQFQPECANLYQSFLS